MILNDVRNIVLHNIAIYIVNNVKGFQWTNWLNWFDWIVVYAQ